MCIEKRGSLTIYAQSTGSSMGQLETSGISISEYDVTICGGQVCCNELYAFDNVTIYDGRITVRNDKEDWHGIKSHNVTIHGGQVSATADDGIYAYETITLGLRNATDYIYASSFRTFYDEYDEGIISVKDGQTLTDGTSIYSGSLGQELSGMTLIRVDVLEDAATNDVDALATRLDGKQTNIILNGRTLYKDGSWNTLCLPFDMTISGSLLDGADNLLYYPGEAMTIGACRAYFQLNIDNLQANIRQFLLNFDGEGTQTTGIAHTETAETTEKPEAWYTLDGRRLNGKPTTKGVYLHGGKKVLVK